MSNDDPDASDKRDHGITLFTLLKKHRDVEIHGLTPHVQ